MMNKWISKKPSKEKQSRANIISEYVGIFLKLTPLIPILGGVILLKYLHLIQHQHVFISAIGSTAGLLAIFIAGAILFISYVFIFVFPISLASYALSESDGKFLPLIPLLVVVFWVAVIYSPPWFLNIAMFVLLPTAVILILYFASKKHWWAVKKDDFFIRIFALWFAVLIAVLPIQAMIKALNLETDFSAMLVIVLYLGMVGILSAVMSRIKDFKLHMYVLAAIAALILMYLSVPVLTATARMIGVRHDIKQWYWAEDDKQILSILPANMLNVPCENGIYIYAATPFSFLDTKILCSTTKDDPFHNEIDISIDNEIDLNQCVVLDKSEIRLSCKNPLNADADCPK